MMLRTRFAWLALVAAFSIPAAASADDYTAFSKTAMSITGDIAFDDYSIVFANGEELRFSALVADHFTVDGESVPASVYSVENPGDPELENGNTLCGGGDVTYIASYSAGDGMTEIAVFTGDEAPSSSASMCASYIYMD
ncbi:hypothetical protein [Pararhizobium sp.]|uniref:hypothetical protein n=1 Tax=Pararhizobium sp. TaxID=1977563 RepID=UPI002725FA4C|nr:hypothetical protein [Pararhizobium sp.]MDO9417504.1 hypothetical protein [Pararhizobium sp.]